MFATTIETNSIPSLQYLLSNQLTPEDLQQEVEYLIPNFLVANSLNVFFAKAGQGKSFLMLSLALTLIRSKKIEQCLYIDMDNSKSALKNRGVDNFIVQHPELVYVHSSKFTDSPRTLLDKLSFDTKQNIEKDIFKGTLFIFDSIRDFIDGDMNSDRDIIKLMQKLKDLREAGGTVIYLHHTTKISDGVQFKGSTSFIDSVDVAYSLSSTRNLNKLTYQLTVHKDRLSVEDCAFELDTQTMILESENLQIASMSENEASFAKEVQAFLKFYPEGIKQSELLTNVGKSSDDKTARKYLHKFANELWKLEKRPKEKNASFYFPIEQIALPIDKPNPPILPIIDDDIPF